MTKTFLSLCAAIALTSPALMAEEEVEVIYTASPNQDRFADAVEAARDRTSYRVLPVMKAQYDSFVYRKEGLATARHDELMSAVISFYVTFEEPTRINLGHSLAR